ncbi:MAG: hypothetical protein Q9187_007493 [Circinaria calcarea]
MLASMRHFLRFIDLDSTFDKYGFIQKKGATFKLNAKPGVYTDFVAAGGPEGYAWNVVRSEADDLMFRHAEKSGAKVFDGVKVNPIEFLPVDGKNSTVNSSMPDTGRPVSASWSRKDDSSDMIDFKYMVDTSGRDDTSGWVWSIPLHNGTRSVGVSMNQDISISRKKSMNSPSSRDYYLNALKLTPSIMKLLTNAKLVSDIKSASNWSYSASFYASPIVRVVGDSGCFIDPFFSSGVHLALASALSAAVTICAAKRHDCDEQAAASWHSHKVAEEYTRFLLVFLSARKQIKDKDEPVLSDWDEESFEKAFAFFRPIIQGSADTSAILTQREISKTVDFCFRAFQPTVPEAREAVLKKLEGITVNDSGSTDPKTKENIEALQTALTPDELRILNTIRARQMMRSEDMMNIDSFGTDAVDGMAANLKRGDLGLVKATAAGNKPPEVDVLALLTGEAKIIEQDQLTGEEEMQEQIPIAAH